MTRQLVLIDERGDDDWRLDEHTRQIGREGLVAAREALAEARRRSAA
jgi:hypothetical protein